MDVRKLKVPALAGMAVVVALVAGLVVLNTGKQNPQSAVMAAPAESPDIFKVEPTSDNDIAGNIEPVEKPQSQAVVDESASVAPVAKPEMKSETLDPAAVTPVEKPAETPVAVVAPVEAPKVVEQPKPAEPVVVVAPKPEPVAPVVVAKEPVNTPEPDFEGSKVLEDAPKDIAVEKQVAAAADKPSLDNMKIAEDAPAAPATQLSKAIEEAPAAPVEAVKPEPQLAAVTAAEVKETPTPENVIDTTPEVIESGSETTKTGWFNAPAAGENMEVKSDSFTLDGTPGGFITPKAGLVNPGKDGQVFGLPAIGVRFTSLGTKDIESFAIGETLFGRLEFTYGLSRMGLGTLKDEFFKSEGVHTDREVYLHTFTLRGMAVKENEFGAWTPAVTGGVQFKYNDGIRGIDNKLDGALSDIGMARANGVDYFLTIGKAIDVFGRKLEINSGMRLSQAAQLGYLGFGDAYRLTFEGNAAYSLTDWLKVGYEFRQKDDPYRKWSGVIGGEDNWQAITADIIINENLKLQGAYGMFGNFANADADGTWSIMLNWQF